MFKLNRLIYLIFKNLIENAIKYGIDPDETILKHKDELINIIKSTFVRNDKRFLVQFFRLCHTFATKKEFTQFGKS